MIIEMQRISSRFMLALRDGDEATAIEGSGTLEILPAGMHPSSAVDKAGTTAGESAPDQRRE